MALLSFLAENSTKGPKKQREPPSTSKHRKKHRTTTQQPSSSSWDQIKNLLSCKQAEGSKIHDPSKPHTNNIGSSCGSICSFRDVVHGNTRVVHRADNSPEGSTVGHDNALLVKKRGTASGRSGPVQGRSNGGSGHSTAPSSRAMQFRKLSGCYECRMIVDPSRYPCPRSSVSVCSQCGEVFPKVESLELHQAVRHAVSELGPEDSGRNIVEIIFKSSWLKKDNPICVIERILKVHNTQRTIQRFEDCRDAVKTRALTSGARKNPRCAADGNELLRFHCTTLSCSLGAEGSSSLCSAVPGCGVCSIIRYGGKAAVTAAAADKGFKGVRTTASSGRAHDSLRCGDGRRAVLVCRVIAGRVRRVSADQAPANSEDDGGAPPAAGHFDSVASEVGAYSNLEELIVFNPKAILPCFVVIYRAVGC